MSASVFDLLFGTLFNGLTALFWLAFLMRWQRISFFAPGGAFVRAATEWAHRPLRRRLPPSQLDWPSVFLAWAAQATLIVLKFVVLGHIASLPLLGVAAVMIVGGAIEALFVLGHLIFWLVIASVLMSWLQPHASLAPVLHALTDPFLNPIRRFVPIVGGIDLSPVVLLLGLQLLAIVGMEARFALMRGLLAALA